MGMPQAAPRKPKPASAASRSSRRAARGSVDTQTPVKPWDFHSAGGVDRVTLTAIRQVAEGLTHMAANRLGTWARSRMTLNVASIDQVVWETFEAQVSSPGLLGAIPVAGGQVFVFLPAVFCMTLLDLRLSGTGQGPFPSRPLTDIERQVLGSALDVVAGCVSDATGRVFGGVETGPVTQVAGASNLKRAGRKGACLTVKGVATISATRAEPGQITVCFPLETVQPLLSQLTETARPGTAAFAAAEEAASRVPIPLALRYRRASIPLSVAERLTPGQVLSLGHPIGEPLTLCSGDRALFAARAVEQHRRSACQIIEMTGSHSGSSGT